MDRRTFVGISCAGVGVLGGCMGTETDSQGSNTTDGEPDSGGDGNSNGSEGSPQLKLLEHRLVREEVGEITGVYVDGQLRNETSRTLASVTVTAQFYDGTGAPLTTGFDSVSTLAPEQIWSFTINFVGTEAAVAGYELATEVPET